jgi:3-oxoacyl-[acyl-carrier-protein] synthase-1
MTSPREPATTNVRPRGFAVSAYGMCNSLGRTTAEIARAFDVRDAESPLKSPPLTLPFETVCGIVADLPPLPSAFHSMDSRFTRMALLAIEDVRGPIARAIARYGKNRVGCVIGTTTGGLARTETAFAERLRTGSMPRDFSFEALHPFCVVVDFVRGLTGYEGPGYVVSTACSSSAKAFGAAERMMRAGICDAVIVGGVDTLCQTTLRGFHSLGVLSTHACRPFGKDRNGISIGEGGAFLLLERQGDGPARLLGTGESMDAHHMSSPDPTGLGAKSAMMRALERGGLSPSDIDYVNAHGTGTPQNDSAEARAIEDVFGKEVPVASTKGLTGHMLGAGGATEAALAILSIERGFVPKCVGADPIDPAVGVNVTRARIDRNIRNVISNSFAFGGSNASVIFGAS